MQVDHCFIKLSPLGSVVLNEVCHRKMVCGYEIIHTHTHNTQEIKFI